MKPVAGVPGVTFSNFCETNIKSETISHEDEDQKRILDALRNTYISENSVIFCKDAVCLERLSKVTQERQAVVEDFIHKFLSLSSEEKLLFFLRLPLSTHSHAHSTLDTKLGILTSRVEIRRTAAWIRSHLQVDNDASIPKRDVYDKYLDYCRSSRMIPISVADFGKLMKSMYPSVRPRRLGTRGKSQYCYAGMTSCQDLERPRIYEDTPTCVDEYVCTTTHEDPCERTQMLTDITKKDNFLSTADDPMPADNDCNNEVPRVAKCLKNSFQTHSDHECHSNEKKCRLRKTILCQKSRFRRPIQPKPLRVMSVEVMDHVNDRQVEEEVAQYFDLSNFCRPPDPARNVVNRGSAENFFRSSSFSDGGRDIPSLESRSQSSVGMFGPWLPYDHSLSSRNSVRESPITPFNSASRDAAEKLSQLQLRAASCSSRNSCASIENGSGSGAIPSLSGFTPITPSPVPWRVSPVSGNMKHIFSESQEENCQTQSFPSTDMKWNFLKDFPSDFSKPTFPSTTTEGGNIMAALPNAWIENSPDSKLLCSEDKRSRSSTLVSDDPIPMSGPPEITSFNGNNFSNVTEPVADITSEELTQMLENSIAMDHVSLGEVQKIEEDLIRTGEEILPPFQNIFDCMKTVVMTGNTKLSLETDLEILPRGDLNTLNCSNETFRPNFDNFF